MSTHDSLIAQLRRTSGELGRAGMRDRCTALECIVSAAVIAVPRADVAGLTLVDDHYLREAAATSVVGKLDALQGERGHGPAATALADAPPDGLVLAEDFAGQDGDRWPEFARRALEAGYRSMMSVVLEVQGAPRGTLNLYGVSPFAFDARARRVAGLLAITVGMLLVGVEQVMVMERALSSRDMIGQAKGMLMERFELDEDAAYAMLVDASQHADIEIVEIARWLERERRAPGTQHLPAGTEPCL